MNDWVDVSVPLRSGMVHWPGDPEVRIFRAQDQARGDQATISQIDMGAHTGTHMDAPLHYLPDAPGLDSMPLGAGIGRARVIEISDPDAIRVTELAGHRILAGERILFKTRNSSRCWNTDAFVKDYVSITAEAAVWLASRGVRTVGVDYLSVGAFEGEGAETHRALLSAGVWIIEGLDLAGVDGGEYEMICLPRRIERSDGAPARVVLRRWWKER